MNITIGQKIQLIPANKFETDKSKKFVVGEYEVKKIGTFNNDLADLGILFLNDDQIITILTVDGETQCLFLRKYEDFVPVTRQQAVDADMLWLFQEPDNESWTADELKFTDNVFDDVAQVCYDKELDMEATYTEEPVRKGLTNMYASFNQYSLHDESLARNYLVLLELGINDNKANGMLFFYQGFSINEDNFKILD